MLIIRLERADGGDPHGIAGGLQGASEGAYIVAGDGSQAEVLMTGDILGPVVGFQVPASAQKFELFWPGNPPIDLPK